MVSMVNVVSVVDMLKGTKRAGWVASGAWAGSILGLCFVAQPALAQAASDGWYLQGHLGAAVEQAADFHVPSIRLGGREADASGELTFDRGWGGGVAAGRFYENARVEGEVLWRRIGIDHLELDPHAGDPVLTLVTDALERNLDITGDMDSLAAFVNVYYDFAAGSRMKPYVGAGLGTVHATMRKHLRLLTPARPEEIERLEPAAQEEVRRRGGVLIYDDEKEDRWIFTWQAMAGLGIEVNELFSVNLGYRYMRPSSVDFHLFAGQRLQAEQPPMTVGVKPLHSVEFGLRRRF